MSQTQWIMVGVVTLIVAISAGVLTVVFRDKARRWKNKPKLTREQIDFIDKQELREYPIREDECISPEDQKFIDDYYDNNKDKFERN